MARMTIKDLHDRIGIAPETPGYGTTFGPRSRIALSELFTATHAPTLNENDYLAFASNMDVPVNHVIGIRKVEAPRGAFDATGKPSILYERHKFRDNTTPVGVFNSSNPILSGPPYGAGGYGSYSSQWGKLLDACALDPEAAFRACSWGAFQVLGENARAIGYESAFDMALSLVDGEGANLEMFRRFIMSNHLIDKFRACIPGDPGSCVPFVRAYNGPGFREFNYHVKLADAIRG